MNAYGYSFLRFAKIEHKFQARFRGTRDLFAALRDPVLMGSYRVHVLYASRAKANKAFFGGNENVMQNHFRAQLIRHRTARLTVPCYLVMGEWGKKAGDTYFPTVVQAQLNQRFISGRGPEVQLGSVLTRDCHLGQIADAIAGAYAITKHGTKHSVKLELAQDLFPAIDSRVIYPWDWRPPP